MVFSIPWYTALFITIPETFLALLVGFKLYNIRVSKRKVALLAILNAAFGYIISLLSIYFGLHTLIMLAFLALLSYSLLKIKFIQAFIAIFTGVIILVIIEIAFMPVILEIFSLNLENLAETPWLNFALFLPSVLVMLLLNVLIEKYSFTLNDLNFVSSKPEKGTKNENRENNDNENNVVPIIIILIQCFVIITLNHYLNVLKDSLALDKLLILINLTMIAFAIVMISSIRKRARINRKLTEINLLKCHLEQMAALTNILQSQKHEHTRHIQTIQAMIHLDEISKAKEYLDGITEEYWHMQDVVNVGHPALTALLNSKQKIAESKGIEFAFSVKCDLTSIKVESWDLCSILGNLIDNAIEAVIFKENKKRVAIEIKQENNNFLFFIINTGPKLPLGQQQQIFEAGYTTKGSEARGYGLFLANKLVIKYKGKINIDCIDGKTTFIVQLPEIVKNNNQKFHTDSSNDVGKQLG